MASIKITYPIGYENFDVIVYNNFPDGEEKQAGDQYHLSTRRNGEIYLINGLNIDDIKLIISRLKEIEKAYSSIRLAADIIIKKD